MTSGSKKNMSTNRIKNIPEAKTHLMLSNLHNPSMGSIVPSTAVR